MARFKADEAENYGGQGGGGFFNIPEDKGVKKVRIMYNTIDDVEGYAVHKVKVNGKERYVNCLREYNDPLDKCPFCRDKYNTQARLFIPIYNIDEDQVQLWDRGKTFFEKITGLCSRYAKKGNLVNNVFEIERHGKPKDMKTTYEIFQVEEDDTEMEDLPEAPQILGGFVLDKTAEDMEYYLDEGEFPPEEEEQEEESSRRRDSRSSERSSSRETGRRTPASSRRRNNDEF